MILGWEIFAEKRKGGERDKWLYDWLLEKTTKRASSKGYNAYMNKNVIEKWWVKKKQLNYSRSIVSLYRESYMLKNMDM